MDDGRDFDMVHGDRRLLPRGVAGPVPLDSSKFDVDFRPPFWRAISSDMRPSLLLSSATANRSAAAGEGSRGLAGAEVLLAPRLFSKKLRREDTGFWSQLERVHVPSIRCPRVGYLCAEQAEDGRGGLLCEGIARGKDSRWTSRPFCPRCCWAP